MKKTIYAILALVMVVPFIIGSWGCKKEKDPSIVRVNEVTHSIFYAPFYIADNLGYFDDEGITIELTNGGGSDRSMTALLTGSADIGLLGPEQAIYAVAGESPDVPVIFGQLTKRDGSFLIGRNDVDNFVWSDLEGKEIIAGRQGGMPAMALEYALNNNGLYNGDNITLNYDIEFNNMGPAFIGGTGDYVTMFDPSATELVNNNTAYNLASVGLEAGEVPFTAFMALDSYISDNEDVIEGFLTALVKGYNYLMVETLDNVVQALKPSFATTSDSSLESSVANYRSIDAWSSSPVMSESAYNRLIDVITNAGVLTQSVDFDDVVDNTYAKNVMLQLIEA